MRLRTLPLALIAALALVALASVGTASAKSCTPAKYPGEGYFQNLSVRGTTCAAGRTVQRRHYSCRVRNGGRDGRCNRRVEGYRCRERRGERIETEYNARVTCTKGSRRIRWGYQQNFD